MTGCAGISAPAVARSRWRWILVSSGTARKTTTRRRTDHSTLGLAKEPKTTRSSGTSCAGIPPVRYRAWLQARGDHGTRRYGRVGAPCGRTEVAMASTVCPQAGPAHPAGFTIGGGASFTPDSGSWATAPGGQDAPSWHPRPGLLGSRAHRPGRLIPYWEYPDETAERVHRRRRRGPARRRDQDLPVRRAARAGRRQRERGARGGGGRHGSLGQREVHA